MHPDLVEEEQLELGRAELTAARRKDVVQLDEVLPRLAQRRSGHADDDLRRGHVEHVLVLQHHVALGSRQSRRVHERVHLVHHDHGVLQEGGAFAHGLAVRHDQDRDAMAL